MRSVRCVLAGIFMVLVFAAIAMATPRPHQRKPGAGVLDIEAQIRASEDPDYQRYLIEKQRELQAQELAAEQHRAVRKKEEQLAERQRQEQVSLRRKAIPKEDLMSQYREHRRQKALELRKSAQARREFVAIRREDQLRRLRIQRRGGYDTPNSSLENRAPAKNISDSSPSER